EELTTHLRVTTYLLAPRTGAAALAPDSGEPRLHPLAPSGAASDFTREIAQLPWSALLVDAGDLAVYCAPSEMMPHLHEEIGRLRELTSRAAGEGTGRARNLDAVDEHYEHLFLWNRRNEEVMGACRLGRVDEIRNRAGRRGLLSAMSFDYREPFFRLLGPALELDNLFVRPEAQDSPAPLMLLWRGIGQYVARHPRYLRLLGTVRIGSDYCDLSRQLFVEYLHGQSLDVLLSPFVRSMNAVPRGRMAQSLAAEVAMLGHLDAVAALVEDIEADRKGVPAQLRQYLRFGGRMLAYNTNPAVNAGIDCLFLIDLRQTDARVLRKYLPAPAVARIAAMSLKFPGLRKAD
ncbi:MAG: GNAT family N-acetyltransferase, partial [Peristeroidobacter soli]